MKAAIQQKKDKKARILRDGFKIVGVFCLVCARNDGQEVEEDNNTTVVGRDQKTPPGNTWDT